MSHGKSALSASVALDGIAFSIVTLDDPVPLGRQILKAANLLPPDAYSLFAILADGDFEDVRLDETFDLRAKGTESFIAFSGDRDYRIFANGRQVRWGQTMVGEDVLRFLAGAKGDEAVYLDVPGGTDRLVKAGETVDLSKPGIERFIVAARPRSFRFSVNGTRYETDQPKLTGLQIKAKVPNWDASHDLVLEGQGNDPDQVIGDDATVDLDVDPARRFSSVPKANFG